ncbi:MAG: hypothetical protein ACK4G1_04685 [Ignavibacteria bacterium]
MKAVCGISSPGPIDEKIHSKKIERARWFGLLEKDSLTLTDLGKLFAVKYFLDLADNIGDEDYDDEYDEEDDDLDEDAENMDDYLTDWDDEDWDDDDDDDDDFGPRRGRRGNRRN